MRPFLYACIVLPALLLIAVRAWPHDMARPELDGWYASLINQWGGSCCDRKDCHPLAFGNKGDPGVDAWIGIDDEGHRSYQFRADPAIFEGAKGQIVNLPMTHRAYQWVEPRELNMKRVAANPYGGKVLVACADFTPTMYNQGMILYCFVPPMFED